MKNVTLLRKDAAVGFFPNASPAAPVSNEAFKFFADALMQEVSEKLRVTHAQAERIAALEASVKYLTPSSQLGDLRSTEPDLIAAREENAGLRKSLLQSERLLERQTARAAVGEDALKAQRQRISELEGRIGVVGLDATRHLTGNKAPVDTLLIGDRPKNMPTRTPEPKHKAVKSTAAKARGRK